MTRRTVFADRDGTLIVERDYLSDPKLVELIPGVAKAVRELDAAGWDVVCVSNQSGLARGKFGLSSVLAVNDRMESLLGSEGAKLKAIYFSPDGPGSDSNRRKPAPGMAQAASKEFGIDLTASVVVGDKPVDIEMGEAIGAFTILVRTGYGMQAELDRLCDPDVVVDSFADIPAIIATLGVRNNA